MSTWDWLCYISCVWYPSLDLVCKNFKDELHWICCCIYILNQIFHWIANNTFRRVIYTIDRELLWWHSANVKFFGKSHIPNVRRIFVPQIWFCFPDWISYIWHSLIFYRFMLRFHRLRRNELPFPCKQHFLLLSTSTPLPLHLVERSVLKVLLAE